MLLLLVPTDFSMLQDDKAWNVSKNGKRKTETSSMVHNYLTQEICKPPFRIYLQLIKPNRYGPPTREVYKYLHHLQNFSSDITFRFYFYRTEKNTSQPFKAYAWRKKNIYGSRKKQAKPIKKIAITSLSTTAQTRERSVMHIVSRNKFRLPCLLLACFTCNMAAGIKNYLRQCLPGGFSRSPITVTRITFGNRFEKKFYAVPDGAVKDFIRYMPTAASYHTHYPYAGAE